MASYKIIPLQSSDKIDVETLEQRIEVESPLDLPDPRKSNAPLRSGPLPQTVQTFDRGITAFEYGFEMESTGRGLDGEERTYILTDRAPVMFLGNGYVAIDAYCSSGVKQEILDLLNDLLGNEIKYETVEFGEDTIRKVIRQAGTIERVDFKPERDSLPDGVSGEHRPGLRDTRMWEDYKDEPVEMVKVSLPERPLGQNVGFKQDGIVTIYGRDLEMSLCGTVLRHITDEVVSNLDVSSFQQKLGGVGS
jgi:hypothetical protein